MLRLRYVALPQYRECTEPRGDPAYSAQYTSSVSPTMTKSWRSDGNLRLRTAVVACWQVLHESQALKHPHERETRTRGQTCVFYYRRV
jgi:hypothetical protein